VVGYLSENLLARRVAGGEGIWSESLRQMLLKGVNGDWESIA
jgi:hypothetical protein